MELDWVNRCGEEQNCFRRKESSLPPLMVVCGICGEKRSWSGYKTKNEKGEIVWYCSRCNLKRIEAQGKETEEQSDGSDMET